MTDAQHTAEKLSYRRLHRGGPKFVLSARIEDVALVYRQEDAERLAHCWNCHGGLLAAILLMVDAFHDDPMSAMGAGQDKAVEAARAAIKSAKGAA